MQHEPTHASFFSGAGGLDLGLERAGWRTVSFSEVDPYACAILANRWPDVPNLGDITDVVRLDGRHAHDGQPPADTAGREWHRATVWSGGFPCQDLSVAGKRKGLAGERSGLAFAFLDLVERHRPPWVLLENVPGLLSSHSGRDLGALLHRLGDIGYGWAYRILDARWFGVPQRRRRVWILAHHVDGHPDYHGPAEVLAVGTRCSRHPSPGREEGEEPADRFSDGTGGAGILPQSVSAKWAKQAGGPAGDEHHNLIVANETGQGWWNDESGGTLAAIRAQGGKQDSTVIVAGPTPDPGGVREAPGMAGWAHDRPVAFDPTAGRDMRAYSDGTSPGMKVGTGLGIPWAPAITGGHEGPDDDLLPLGLDSHRYRVIGNGVAAPVATWIGQRLREYICRTETGSSGPAMPDERRSST